MSRRRLGLAAAALALTVPLAGCMTVHGERALIPSATRAQAAQVLAHFAAQNNKATKAYDEQAVASIEAGPLGAIDQAGVRARHVNSPQGNPDFTPLVFSDTTYVIPKQRGWPKFFLAETKTNRNGDARWLLAFRRSSPADPWKADFLATAAPDALPDFLVDKDGYARAVPLAGTDLLVQPGQLSSQYARYLDAGDTSGTPFAPGPATTGVRADHQQNAKSANTVTQYADQADTAGDFAPVALRTKDGGAVVFFASRHQSRSTFRAGYRLNLDKDTQALTSGTPKTSITLSHVAQSMVRVPAKSAGGQVEFVSRLVGLVAATGA
jgi:hypothetical protein